MTVEQEKMLSLAVAACRAGAMRKMVLSQPIDKSNALRQSGRLSIHRGARILLMEAQYEGGRVAQKLVDDASLLSTLTELFPLYRQINLLTEAGDAELKINRKGHALLLGEKALSARLSGDTPDFAAAVDILPLESKKNYILTGDEPFLIALGVSDARGRVHDKRQAKFRQINRFLEHLSDLYPSLPAEGELLVYDLCCGKSYLSFAVYHYLHILRGRPLRMVCVDLKRDVMEFCADVARRAAFDGMEFLCGDVRRVTPVGQPDLVISLHACDIATDLVLEQAITLGAGAILATPCCHRYVSERLNCAPLSFVTDHAQLRGKLAEALTEGLRILHLKRFGYRVSAVELTDPDDTPKNTLLRAVRRRNFDPESRESKRLEEEYRRALTFLMPDAASHYPEDL